MGRPKLPAATAKSRKLRLRLTPREHEQLEELARLPIDKLSALFEIIEPPKFASVNQATVIRRLIDVASLRLRAARDAGAVWAKTGRSLTTWEAADRLDVSLQTFRSAAKLAGVVGRRDKRDYGRWSEADVERVREYREFEGTAK